MCKQGNIDNAPTYKLPVPMQSIYGVPPTGTGKFNILDQFLLSN